MRVNLNSVAEHLNLLLKVLYILDFRPDYERFVTKRWLGGLGKERQCASGLLDAPMQLPSH